MIELALKARLPLIKVSCDDPLHLEVVLQSIAGHSVEYVEKIGTQTLYSTVKPPPLLWSDKEEIIKNENFQRLQEKDRSLVLVNTRPHPLVFDAGPLLPPENMALAAIKDMGGEALLLPVVKGLTLKAIHQLLALTSSKYGDLQPKHARAMRIALGQTIQGLYPIETDLGYYETIPDLEKWIKVQGPYFLSESVPDVLVPRGLLFEGPPGTGKTMAARYIANKLQIPLYRLDVSTTLARYIGESEARLAQSFVKLDHEAPCVVLFDEVEKLFVSDSDSGVIDRMLSQLLWWLQEHRSRVFTVMTSNDIGKLPIELYRPGRIDDVIKVTQMTPQEATQFARRLLIDLMKPDKPTLKQINSFTFTPLQGSGKFSHAQIAQTVYNAVKVNNWIPIDKPG